MNYQHDPLLLLMLASYDDQTKPLAPVKNTPVWMDHNGWFDRGKRILNAPIEISSINRNERGEAIYRLRSPREDGKGYEYTNMTFEDLHGGLYYFRNRSVTVFDPIRASMILRSQYESLSQADKDRLLYDEYQQRKREHDEKLSREFRISGKLPFEA